MDAYDDDDDSPTNMYCKAFAKQLIVNLLKNKNVFGTYSSKAEQALYTLQETKDQILEKLTRMTEDRVRRGTAGHRNKTYWY